MRPAQRYSKGPIPHPHLPRWGLPVQRSARTEPERLRAPPRSCRQPEIFGDPEPSLIPVLVAYREHPRWVASLR